MRTSFLLKCLLWSMLIFAFSVALFSFRSLRGLELKIANLSSPFRSKLAAKFQTKADAPAVPLSLWGQASHDVYLRHALAIVKNLKKAGAKVVVLPLPSDILPVPKILDLLDKLKKQGIVVFGATTSPSQYFSRSVSYLEDPKNWWVRQPALHRVSIPWGVLSMYTEPFAALYRFVPSQFRDFDTGEPVPDIALQALKRYLGYPDSLEIRHTPYYDSLGPHTIPLERDGFAYVKHSFHSSFDGGVFASLLPETDSLIFFPTRWSGKKEPINLDSSWAFYNGKIVVLDWGNLSQFQFPSFGLIYAQIVNAILHKNFVDRYNDYDLFFIALVVISLSVVSYHFRGIITVLVSFVLGVGIVVLSIWLFDRYSILYDPVYVLVPIVLCGFILPIVRLAEEKRVLEEAGQELGRREEAP
ncbi:MAG: hypothetical protein AABZ02_05915 [Bacteroidota bacterium]